MKDLSVLDSWLFTAMCAFLAVMGFLYLWPGVYRRLLPPQRQRAVPWSGAEILLTLFLLILFWPAFCSLIVEKTHLLQAIYGDAASATSHEDGEALDAGSNDERRQQMTQKRQANWNS